MKIQFIALAMTLMFCGCATSKCPPIAQPLLGAETNLKQFRLSGVVVDVAKAPQSKDASIAEDTAPIGGTRGQLLSTTTKILRSSFKQPGEKDYDSAPAVQIRCTADALKAGSLLLYSVNKPAQFAATLAFMDPNTGAQLYSAHYSKEFEAVATNCSDACINKTIGQNAFQNAVRDVVIRFSNNVPRASTFSRSPREAPIDGTLEYVEGVLPLTFANLEMIMFASRNGDPSSITRIAENAIPNKIQREIDQARLFSNSTKATFKIASYVTKGSYRPETLMTEGAFSFSVDTVVFKNGKEIANFVFVSNSVPARQQDAELERQAAAVLKFLKDNIEKLNKDEDKNEKNLVNAHRDAPALRLRKTL